jgi:hypothetical protein
MSKNFMQKGKWIDKPMKTIVLVCACGNKYIKTRHKQAECLRCLTEVKRSR